MKKFEEKRLTNIHTCCASLLLLITKGTERIKLNLDKDDGRDVIIARNIDKKKKKIK